MDFCFYSYGEVTLSTPPQICQIYIMNLHIINEVLLVLLFLLLLSTYPLPVCMHGKI